MCKHCMHSTVTQSLLYTYGFKWKLYFNWHVRPSAEQHNCNWFVSQMSSPYFIMTWRLQQKIGGMYFLFIIQYLRNGWTERKGERKEGRKELLIWIIHNIHIEHRPYTHVFLAFQVCLDSRQLLPCNGVNKLNIYIKARFTIQGPN